jgi:transcriptional regulator with XRE-family HTH domain
LVLEMKEAEGRSEREIAEATGVSASTVHRIVRGAHGWGEVADREVLSVIVRNRTKRSSRLTGRWQPKR